jgi:PERQ amino acid-rich with GYF domain-containing protein
LSGVNSPIKPQNTPATKENGTNPTSHPGRRPSASGSFGQGIGGATPGGRRYDGDDPSTNPSVTSPISPLPHPNLFRRKTDRDPSSPSAFGSIGEKNRERTRGDLGEDTSTSGASPFRRAASSNVPTLGSVGESNAWATSPNQGGFGSFSLLSSLSPVDKKTLLGKESKLVRLMNTSSVDEYGHNILREKASIGSLGLVPEGDNQTEGENQRTTYRAQLSNVESDPFSGESTATPVHAATRGLRTGGGASENDRRNSSGVGEPNSPTETNPYQSPAPGSDHSDGPVERDSSSFAVPPSGGDSRANNWPNMPLSGLRSSDQSSLARDVFELGGNRFSSNSDLGLSQLGNLDSSQLGNLGSSHISSILPTGMHGRGTTGQNGDLWGFEGGEDPSAAAGSRFSAASLLGRRSQVSETSTKNSLHDAQLPIRNSRNLFDSAFSQRNSGSIDEFSNNRDSARSDLTGQLQTSIPSAPFRTASSSFMSPGAQTASDLLSPNLTGFPQGLVPNPSLPGQPASSTNTTIPAPQPGASLLMPDKARWVYKDHEGQVQGPFSGLEMHDWYRAGFFTPELFIRRTDQEVYESLGDMIRRIGNSREPFLVPQVGYKEATEDSARAQQIASPSGTVQPPFASSFPSFGTTLTAEQQNALERRKQEEQYLMARQREYLAIQQQIASRNITGQHGPHTPGVPHHLNHYGSSHSLQSQPSFGSIGADASAQINSMHPPSMNDTLHRHTSTVGPIGIGSVGPRPSTEEMTLAFNRMSGASGVSQQQISHNQRQSQESLARINQGMYFRESLAVEQAEAEKARESGAQEKENGQETHGQSPNSTQNDRLEEFRRYQAEMEQAENEPSFSSKKTEKSKPVAPQMKFPIELNNRADSREFQQTDLLVEPFPAPQSQPLKAVPVSRSPSETPVESPSIAPWAKEAIAISKGPSLKEIQESEARRAAIANEEMARSKRQQMEEELRLQAVTAANAPSAPSPGLPSTSMWGRGSTPEAGSVAPTVSPWTKPVVAAPTQNTAGRKSLAQIQKEEEARKQKLAVTAAAATAASAASATSISSPVMGGVKRYADLASKAPLGMTDATGAWTTVGASGKLKSGGVPVGGMPRSVSTTAIPASPASVHSITSSVKSRPLVANRSLTTATSIPTPKEELAKWAAGELRPAGSRDKSK